MSELKFQRVGDDYCLSFAIGEQALNLTLDLEQARSLFLGLGATLAHDAEGASLQTLEQKPILDVYSPTFQIGSDDEGHPILALKVDPLPPFRFRFSERQAREIAKCFLEIVETPMDIRTSKLLS